MRKFVFYNYNMEILYNFKKLKPFFSKESEEINFEKAM